MYKGNFSSNVKEHCLFYLACGLFIIYLVQLFNSARTDSYMKKKNILSFLRTAAMSLSVCYIVKSYKR
ncbi:hypothetical protein C0033_09085 [Clostridium sp. chh4-2]|nr:hypothetical protein C0033_09085 [Clostridium sp. chh4-2]